MTRKINDDLVIVLAGEAGQGIQSIESILSLIVKRSGMHFYSTSEFMSRVRGGCNSTEIRISSKPVTGFRNRIDILIPLNSESIQHLSHRITEDTLIVGEIDIVKHEEMIDVPFTRFATEAGSALYSNTVAAGCICGLLKIDEKECEPYLKEYFAHKPEDIISKNLEAFRKGFTAGINLQELTIVISRSESLKTDIMLSGADAVALGALSAGCDYVCGYPMSPATSVLEKMAAFSKRHDIVVEQVEDEIGVVNMALGAWYAGARAFVSTSGGGFALMTEGISLAGMIESPFVLHLAQRPGPATGLPTRTEQGDLDLVLYGGHGDFPRIIFAPGTITEAFYLTQKAFSLAERLQVPVFILTDQYFVDTRYNVPAFVIEKTIPQRHIVKTTKDYERFSFTDSGISPRGVPGYGEGLVCVDSDEHDVSGHITENLDLRVKMVNKRKEKSKAILAEVILPTLTGPADYTILIVCWGSTYPVVTEAVSDIAIPGMAILHFSQVFPLPESINGMLGKAARIVSVENNSSAQFTRLLSQSTGILIEEKILKYNGLPFSVEELRSSIQSVLGGEKNNG